MALLTIQEQVATLLQRNLVEDKTRGTPSVQVEAAAVLDSVALNLVFNPRTVLYFAHLARNALLRLVGDELASATTLEKTIEDLGNQSYSLRDLKSLQRAKTSLLQIETQGQVLSTEGAFKGFDEAVSDFLNKQLSKNVRKQGVADLVRPSVEAERALPPDYEMLKSLHSQVDARLGYLMNGVRAFSSESLAGVIGLNVAFRVRRDIEAIIADLESDPTAAGSREYAIRLISAQSVLGLLGTPPNVFDAKVSTNDGLPYGYSLHAVSAVQPNVQISNPPGPWTIPFGTQNYSINITPGGGVSDAFWYGDAPMMLGSTTGPWTIPAQGGLFFVINGNSYRVVLNDSGSPATKTAAEVVAAINAQVGTYIAAQKGWTGTQERIGMRSYTPAVFSLTDSILVPHSGATSGADTLWTNSVRELLGLPTDSDDGVRTPLVMTDFFTTIFAPLSAQVQVTAQEDTVTVTTSLVPGQTVELFAPILFTPLGHVPAYSEEISLAGTYLGQEITPDLPSLVGRGDTLTSSTGTSPIASVGESLLLDFSLPLFDGPVVIESGLVKMWQELQLALDAFAETWLRGGSLDKLETAIAPLYGSPTLARRNDALDALHDLVVVLESLQTVLSSYPLVSAVDSERGVAEGIMATLLERKFDRARAFLLQGRFVEVFALDWQTASFSGEMLAAASAVAKTDITWPSPSTEERHLPYAEDDSLEVP